MVGDDAQRDIGCRSAIFDVEHFAGLIDDGPEQIRFVVADLSLQHRSDTFKTHSRIDRRLRQGRQMTFRIAVELHEYEIPDLHIPPAIAGKRAIRVTQLARLRAEIVMNL